MRENGDQRILLSFARASTASSVKMRGRVMIILSRFLLQHVSLLNLVRQEYPTGTQ